MTDRQIWHISNMVLLVRNRLIRCQHIFQHSWLHYSQQLRLTLLKLGSEPIDYCNHHQYPIGNESYQHISSKCKKMLGILEDRRRWNVQVRADSLDAQHLNTLYQLSQWISSKKLPTSIISISNFLLRYHADVDWSIDLKLMCCCQCLEISVLSCVRSNRIVHSWHF